MSAPIPIPSGDESALQHGAREVGAVQAPAEGRDPAIGVAVRLPGEPLTERHARQRRSCVVGMGRCTGMSSSAEIAQLARIDASQTNSDRAARCVALRTGEGVAVMDRGDRAREIPGRRHDHRIVAAARAYGIAARRRQTAGESNLGWSHPTAQ